MKSRRYRQRSGEHALVLIANGFDAGFVVRCVAALREAGMRTYLIGLESRYITSRHGIEIQADEVLRRWLSTGRTRLVVIPGHAECVVSLTREPLVPALVKRVAIEGGYVAVSTSAETVLNKQIETQPPAMHILPSDTLQERHILQRERTDDEFIRMLVQHAEQS